MIIGFGSGMVLLAAVLLLVVPVLLIANRRAKRIGAELEGKVNDNSIRGEHRGRHFRLKVQLGSGTLDVHAASGWRRFRAWRPGRFERSTRPVVPRPRTAPLDSDPDANGFIVETSQALSFVNRPEFPALLYRFGEGVRLVERRGRDWRLVLRLSKSASGAAEEARHAMDTVIELDELFVAEDRIDGNAGAMHVGRDVLRLVARLVVLLPVLWFWGKAKSNLTDRMNWLFMRDSLVWGSGAAGLVLLAMSPRLLGGPRGWRPVIGWAGRLFMFGFFAAFLALPILDRFVGQAKSRRVEAVVLSAREGPDNVALDVESWNGVNEVESIKLPLDRFKDLQPGHSRIDLEVSTGWLGYERVVAASVIER